MRPPVTDGRRRNQPLENSHGEEKSSCEKESETQSDADEAALLKWIQRPGFCPHCRKHIGRGIAAHIKKCQLTQKFKLGSTIHT